MKRLTKNRRRKRLKPKRITKYQIKVLSIMDIARVRSKTTWMKKIIYWILLYLLLKVIWSLVL